MCVGSFCFIDVEFKFYYFYFQLSSQFLGSTVKEGSRPNSPPVERSPLHAKSSKHVIPRSAIVLCKALGAGEFGTVQQGVWTNDDGERVRIMFFVFFII